MTRSCRWPELTLRGGGEWVLFLTGINLTLLNFVLVQHASVAFREAEMAVLLFSLSFFCGISLGYGLAHRLRIDWIRRCLPVFLGMQLFLLVFLQPLHYVITRDVGAWAEARDLSEGLGAGAGYLVGFLLIMGGATSLYSVFLPRIVDDESSDLRRAYSVEVAGSLLGLLLVPVLSILSHQALLGGYLVSFLGICIGLRLPRPSLAGLALVMAAFLLGYGSWDRATSAWFYKQWYGSWVEDVVETRYTPYHKIEVLDIGGGEHMLTLNGKRQFARGSHYKYSYYVAEYPARMLGSPTVCLLGCGSMSTVGRIGDFVPSIQIVDLDPAVFATSRKYFQKYNRIDELTNWKFTADDAKHYMATAEETYDLILHDIPPAKSRQIALTYTAEFFRDVKDHLTREGLFSIASLTPLSSSSRYGDRMIATLTSVFDRYVLFELGSSVYFYGGGAHVRFPDRETLRAAIEHSTKDDVKIYIGSEVDALVEGETIITRNNVGDLIYD